MHGKQTLYWMMTRYQGGARTRSLRKTAKSVVYDLASTSGNICFGQHDPATSAVLMAIKSPLYRTRVQGSVSLRNHHAKSNPTLRVNRLQQSMADHSRWPDDACFHLRQQIITVGSSDKLSDFTIKDSSHLARTYTYSTKGTQHTLD